jgi:hypothetical protein
VGLFPSLAVPGWASDARANTLAWVAPEVADGAAADVRSDVFSVGALLHLLLTGNRPFPGESAAQLRKRQADGPPPPPACEGRLQIAVQTALQPDPAARFPSVEAFSEALRPIFTSRASRARGDLAMLVRRLSAQLTATPAPREPVLNDAPTRNTFAGVGTGDAVPVHKDVLPGPATENMEVVLPVLPITEAMPVVPVPDEAPSVEPEDAAPRLPVEPAKPPPRKDSFPPTLVEPPRLDAAPVGEKERPRAQPLTQPVLPVLPATGRMTAMPDPPATGRRRGLIAGLAAVVALAGAGLYIFWSERRPPEKPPEKPPVIAPSPLTTQREQPASPSPIAALPPAGVQTLQVKSTPPAELFVDGEPRGQTPVVVAVDPGPHQMVLVAEGMRLHKQEVRAPAEVAVELERAQTSGPAGLKVRCKSKGELRIFVDGKDTGLGCPNETRINVEPGEHTVGLFSPRTGKTVESPAEVKEGQNHSTRIFLNY